MHLQRLTLRFVYLSSELLNKGRQALNSEKVNEQE